MQLKDTQNLIIKHIKENSIIQYVYVILANVTLLKIYSLLYKHGTYSEEWSQLTFQSAAHFYWQVLLPESMQKLIKKDENVHGFAIRGELLERERQKEREKRHDQW